MTTSVIPGVHTFHHRVTRVANPPLVEVLVLREHRKRIGKHELPPPDLLRILIDAYFDSVNSDAPLLHRPSFERAVAAGMADSDSTFRCLRASSSPVSRAPLLKLSCAVFIVLALGARFVDEIGRAHV